MQSQILILYGTVHYCGFFSFSAFAASSVFLLTKLIFVLHAPAYCLFFPAFGFSFKQRSLVFSLAAQSQNEGYVK